MSIKKLILGGENVQLDFKKTISNLEKIAKTLVAFANRQGGTLLIGVTDEGRINGVKMEDEERYMINKAAHHYCKPAIEVSFEEIYVDEKMLVLAHIPESDTKPHYAKDEGGKWWVYYRIHDKSVLATKTLLEVIKARQEGKDQLLMYTEDEKQLLTYLDTHERIDLPTYSRLIQASTRKARRILVRFILAGILQPHTSEKDEYFTLAPQES